VSPGEAILIPDITVTDLAAAGAAASIISVALFRDKVIASSLYNNGRQTFTGTIRFLPPS
jgi:hypothetical protein